MLFMLVLFKFKYEDASMIINEKQVSGEEVFISEIKKIIAQIK